MGVAADVTGCGAGHEPGPGRNAGEPVTLDGPDDADLGGVLMPTYAYQAVDSGGKRERGRAFAASTLALERTLGARGLLVLEIAEPAEDGGRRGFRPGRRREILEVTRALAALLPVGMPLTQALGAALHVGTGDVRAALAAVRGRVERGEMLADALAAHGALFPPLYVGLVRAGERSGDLAGAFARLAEQLEREERLRGRLASAAVYPILLSVAGSVAVAVLLVFVLPRFAELLEGSGASLPPTTAFMLSLSVALRRWWPALLLVPAGLVMFGTWTRATADGRRALARLLLAVPVLRSVRQNVLAARFARLTGVLLGGGAPLVAALDDVRESLADPVAADDVARVRTAVREGRSLRDAVAASPVYPPLLAQLVGVGEEAGQLRTFLLKAAEIFEERSERAAQRLATLAEPALIMLFGAVVAFVALSLLQAIYGVNESSFR
ncbi:secretion system protein [Gemmatimonadetes bacterium T265]|nr:secretion system protein [Gemmatimonadetes bacterium T265]